MQRGKAAVLPPFQWNARMEKLQQPTAEKMDKFL